MILRYVLFIGIALLVVGGGHLYLYRRLVRDTTTTRRGRALGGSALVLLAVILVAGRVMQRQAPGPFSDLIGGIGFVWMGLGMFLVLAFGAVDLFRLGRSLSGTSAPVHDRAPVDPARRLFLARATAGGAAAVATGFSSYGIWRAYHPPSVTEVVMKVPKLPKALDGFSIVQLTDIHVGNMIERRFMDELVRAANAAKPDLFAITGDLVDGDVPTLGNAVAALSGLNARYGSYFVTGNHEYYAGDRAWTAFLQTQGVQVLRNRHVTIGDAGASFDLVGVDDWRGRSAPGAGGGDYDLDKALWGHSPDRAAVLLAHQPANYKVAVTKGIDVQLSGHTHGGQLWPITLFIGLGWEHAAGHYRQGDSHIYVSRGCGFWGPPMRVGAPPEIVKVILTT